MDNFFRLAGDLARISGYLWSCDIILEDLTGVCSGPMPATSSIRSRSAGDYCRVGLIFCSCVSGVCVFGALEHALTPTPLPPPGKVHGSLARAGKVKGQTPKVEAQEKRKKKTGRAKRRIQYRRRFVTVVTTFGKKKGPNANS